MAVDWQYEFEQSMEGVADFIEERLQKKLDEYDFNVTGNLKKSLEVEADDDAQVVVSFADYGLVLNRGLSGLNKRRNTPYVVSRRSSERSYNEDGGRVGIRWINIFDWVKARGIQFAGTTRKGTASIITRHIRSEGYAARPWLDDILVDELPEIDRRIERALDEMVEVNLITEIDEGFSNTGR